MTKTCSKCKISKPLHDFNKSNSTKDGYRTDCMVCRKGNRNKIKEQKYNKQYKLTHKYEYQQWWKLYGREYNRNYKRNKRNNNIEYKILSNTRRRLILALKDSNSYKQDTTLNLIGCSPNELKCYLESKFQPGMTWDNYGYHGWHIDHITACAHFNLSDPVEQKQCFHYTNLQPLWAKDNLKKGAMSW